MVKKVSSATKQDKYPWAYTSELETHQVTNDFLLVTTSVNYKFHSR